ncbi:MAG TPA: hypothetical protein VMT22_06950 [Terriglobales bacterium]|nr:hypothetical protein [Terriglobales bacterium]
MPSDQTRRLLKLFGVAVTVFEDAVTNGASAEEIARAEAEVDIRFQEIATLVDQWRATVPRTGAAPR